MPASLNDPVYRHRTVQVLVDAALVGLAYFLAYLLRFDQGIPERYQELLGATIAFVIVGKVAIFAAFGLYQKWWRYVGLRDFETILKAVVVASLALVGVLFVWSPTDHDLPRSIAVMDLLLTAALIGGVRLAVRSVLERPPRGSVLPKGQEILIVGAGEAGQLVAREMLRSPDLGQTPIGFIDDDPRKRGMRIHGLKVLGTTDKLDRLLDDVEPDEVIIAIPSAPGVLREKVVRACRERDIPVRTLPGVFELISGSVNLMRQVREVRVEDVLGRDPVPFEIARAGAWLRDRKVLVTGAGIFVLVSTDKAVRPATALGASKAIAEWIAEAWGHRYPSTTFCCVRFGNVLGSSGSVVPLFRRQIEQGGPVTVTDPAMARYFMTIPEAVQLIIRAGNLSRGGEVFVLEMGDPVNI